MYVQHPYKFDGKYFANVDGEFIEITKEVAMAMLSDYRKQIYRSRKWAPETEDKEAEAQRQEEDSVIESMTELVDDAEDNDTAEVDKEAPAKSRKWKRKVKYTEILDCAFSANADGLGVGDLADETQMSVEEWVILRDERQRLHKHLSKLTEHEQFLIRSIYFDGMSVTDMGKLLGISKGRVSQKLANILKKMRKMFEDDCQ